MVAPVLQPLEDTNKQSIYMPEGTWYDFWNKKKFVSRGEWLETSVAPLDTMPIWVKAGSMLCWTKDRMRTFNNVGTIETIEVYGNGDWKFMCGDGQGGVVEVAQNSDETWICTGRPEVRVNYFN